jgi:transitional endoplasmic reticulum ATPase
MENFMRHERLWYQELFNKYLAYVGHMFLLNLNVADLILVDKENDVDAQTPAQPTAQSRPADAPVQPIVVGDISGNGPDTENVPVGKEAITINKFLFREMMKKFKIVLGYNRSSGFSFLNPKMEEMFKVLASYDKSKPLPASPLDALPILERVLRMHPREARPILIKNKLLGEHEKLENVMALTIGFAETIAPAGDLASKSPEDRNTIVTLARWARQQEIEASSNLIILMTHNLGEIADCLKTSMSKIEVVKVPFPDFNARLEFIRFLQEDDMYSLKFNGLTPESLANITAGLSLINLRDLALRSKYDEIPLDADFVWDMKKKILAESSGGLLEVIRPKWGFESIGGLDVIKNYFQTVADALVKGDILRIPMGILLLGCPGTGKTVSVEALAKQAGFCMVKLKNIRNMWVGSSERNQSRVHEILRAISPVIAFIDEIDQKENARGSFSGDSGVSDRLRGGQMEFMSDTSLRGLVLWIAASNRPDLMDPATLRTGRFDVKIPFFPPEKTEIPLIFRAIFIKMNIAAQGQGTISAEVLDEQLLQLAEKMPNFVGSDIETICHRAYDFACRRGAVDSAKNVVITFTDLQQAVDDFIPSQDSQSNDYMTMLALKEANSKALLPEKYRNMPLEDILKNLSEARPSIIEKDTLAGIAKR